MQPLSVEGIQCLTVEMNAATEKNNLAVIYHAKYYCENCDSVCYFYTWEDILNSGGVQRCECSDYEDEDE